MAGFTSIIAVASLGLGVASEVKKRKQLKEDRKETNKRLEQQKTEAREKAKLRGTEADTGAKIKIGAADILDDETSTSNKGTSQRKTRTGVGGFGVSASKIGGL